MMDFNLILLLVGVGLLVLVVVFALLGFFAGLKKELKCTAIAFVLIALALLVYGDPSTFLNASVNSLKGLLSDVPATAETIWDYVVFLAQTNVPGGAEIFVEGSKSYAFLYDVVGGVARGVMLLVGTLMIFIITLIVNGIFRLVTRIVSCSKAKKKAASGEVEKQPEPDKNVPDNVLVAKSEAGEAEGVVISTNKVPESNKKSKHRGWAALLAGVRCVVVILFLFAPISGICTVLDSISPKTEELINDVLTGENTQTATSETALDIALDFKDSYYDSAVGMFVESSAFFFDESISTKLFDDAFKIETDTENIKIREEILVVLNAVNALEGNIKFDSLSEKELNGALDALKDSKLIVAAMPVALEVAYYLPLDDNNNTLGAYLSAASQQAAFLQLRNADWDKNIEILLDTVKEAYKLGFLDEDFNVLTMDDKVLKDVVNVLSQSDVVCSLLNIAVPTALNVKQITDVIGKLPKNPDMSVMNWKEELNAIIDIYATFQELEITSLEGIDTNQLVSDILNNDEQFDIVANIVAQVFKLQLVEEVALDVAFNYVANISNVKDAGYKVTKAVRELADLDWENDIVAYLEAVKLALPMLDFKDGLKPNVNPLALDVDILNQVVNKLFETESFEKILPIATNVALALPAVQKLTGEYKVTIDTSKIDWKKDFTTLVSIYEEFLKLGITSFDEVTKDVLKFANETFSSAYDTVAVSNILNKLATLDLFTNVVVPFGNSYAKQLLSTKEFDPSFIELLDLTTLSVSAWQEDFSEIVKVAVNVNELCGFKFDLKSMDLSEAGIAEIKQALTSVLNLNLLKDDSFKNALVKQVLTLTKVFDAEVIEEMNFDSVAWLDGELNEHDNLQALLDCVSNLSSLKGVDLNNVKFDFNQLLSSQDFVDVVISALEVVADSNLILEIFPAAIDKFVIPQLEKLDDEDGTLNDIINHLESKELVEEVQKLVVAFKSAIDLGVFDVSKDGLNAIHFENTDAMKTIINAIFDSKILEGYEARVIRLALKLTKIFPDLEKGAFEGIDFDREQQILIRFINNLEVVLQDPDFLVFKDGVFQLYKEFYTKDETLDAFLNGLYTLFGKYSETEETSGSKLIETLLPLMVEKYVLPAVPENLKDLVEIFDLEEPNKVALASDVRRIIYVFELAVDMKVQQYLVDNDYDFSQSFDNVSKIVEVLFNLYHIRGNEAKAVAWALNYVQSSAKLDIAEFTESDFAGINWSQEVENLQAIVKNVYDIVNANDIATVNKLISFVKDKAYLKESFLNNDNAELALQLVEKVFGLQTVDQVLPVGLEYVLKLAKDKNFDVSFIGENMTAELLAEDLISVVDALRIAVYDLNLIDYYHAKWTGDLPEIDPVLEILDIVFDLNLINGRENQLLQFAVEKFLPANDFIKASDLDFSFEFDFDSEWEVIKDALRVGYNLLPLNNLHTIDDVKAFISEKQYMPVTNLLSDENLLAVADLLDVLSESKLVQDALVAAIRNGVELDKVEKIGNFRILKNLNKPELASDIRTIAEIIRAAVKLDVVTLYFEKDIVIDYDQVATILDLVAELNIINKCASSIIPEVLNYVVSSNANIEINHKFSKAEFNTIDFKEEFALLGDVLIECGELFNSINLDSLQDVLTFIKNGDYTNEIVLTTENVNKLLGAVDLLVQSKLLAAVSVGALDLVVNLAAKKNIDLSFLDGILTNEELSSDLGVIAEILHNVVDFGAIEYLRNKDIDPLEIDYVINAVALLDELNLLAKASPEWTALVAEIVVDKLKVDVSILASSYEHIDYSKENLLLQQALKEIAQLLDNENLESIKEIQEYVTNKYFTDVNAFNDGAINNLQNLVRMVAQSEVIKVNLVSLVEFGAKALGQQLNMDLSFVEGKFTNEELANDINKLVDISEYAVEFGVVELVFNKDLAVIDLQPVIELVALLEEVNLLVKCNKDITALVYNKVLPMLGIDKVVEVSEFDGVDFANENQALRNALRAIKGLLYELDLESIADIKEFVSSKAYMESETYVPRVYTYLSSLADALVASKLAAYTLPIGLNYAVDKLSNDSLDITFLKDAVTGEELAEDIRTLVDIAKYAIEFGALDLVVNKELNGIDLQPVIELVALLEEVNLLVKCNKDITALVFNKVLPMLNINQVVKASDFDDVDFANENQVLRNALQAMNPLLDELNLESIADIKEFVSSKAYMKSETYSELVYDCLSNLVDALVESQLVAYVLPIGLDYAVDKLAAANLDLTYLKGELTGEELASDLRVVLDEVLWWLETGEVLQVIETKAIKPSHLDDLANTLNNLDNTNLYNVDPLKFIVNVTNFAAASINYSGRIDESYFDGISNWQKENEKLYAVIREINDIVETFGVEHDILSLEKLQEFAKSGLKNKEIYTEELLTSVEEVLRAIADAKVLVSELVFVHEYLDGVLATKGIYIDYTIVEANLLAKDFATLADFVEAVVAVDALDYVLNNGKLNQRYVEKFADALVDVLNMNTLSAEGAKEKLLVMVFEKLGVNVAYSDLHPIDWDAELVALKDIILSANEALHAFELDTLDSFKSLNLKEYLKINADTNKYLCIIAEALEAVASSELVEKLILPLSEKYLASESLAGIADLHNIYNDGSQVVSDLNKLASAVYGIVDLDLDSFINADNPIPYGNTEAVNSIIRGIFGLDYFNNGDNLINLVAKLTKMDLSGIDASALDLAGDGELLVDMYANLLTILLDDEFFLKDRTDLKNMVVVVRYWSQEQYVNALRASINDLFDTSIVRETNGAIFLALVPVLKNAAPDIYEALDPERLTISELTADGNTIINILRDVLNANISEILNGSYFTEEVELLLTNTIDRLSNLNLLAGRGAALANAIANRFDCKKIGNIEFYAADYDFDAVDYYKDAGLLNDIIHEVFKFLRNQNIVTNNDLVDYVNILKSSLKDELMDDANLESIKSILGYAVELTIVEYNGLQLYNLFGEEALAKVTNDKLADLESIYANAVEFHADLVKLYNIFVKLVDAGLVDVVNGETINYDQADLVKEVLNLIAEVKYLNESLVELVEFVDSKSDKVDLSSIDFAQVDLSNDLSILGNIYEQLIPVLKSDNNPFTTLDAIKAGSINKSDLYALIYDYQSIYPSVIELASNITIVPQLVKFAYNKVEGKLTGNVATIVQILNIEAMNDAELREDLVVIAEALEKVESLDILRYVLYKDDIEITDNAGYAELVDAVFRLHMVDNNFVELVEELISTTLNVDLSSVDFSSMNPESEQALLVEIVNDVVVVMNSLDVVNLSQVKPYVKDLVASMKADVTEGISLLKNKQIKAGIKKLLDTVLDEARKVNLEVSVEVVEQLCASEIIVKVLLPVYEQKVAVKLSGVLAMVGDIHNYNEDQLRDDLALVANITRNIYESGVYSFVSERSLPGKDECVPYLEAAIIDICNLTILDIKKQDLGPIAQTVLENMGLIETIRQIDKDFDLSQYDCASISFAADASQYALMAAHGYDVLEGLLSTGFNMGIFGNTKAMTALVEIYTLSIDTTAMDVIGHRGLNAVSKLAGRFNMTINEDDKEVLYNVSEFLFGLVELGVFSNDGIDLTKASVIDGMINNLYGSINLPTNVQSLINRVVSRAYAYGVIPFDWRQISVRNEAKVAIDVAKLVGKFVNNHTASIKTGNLSIFADAGVQDELTEIIRRIADSGFVQQLFFPVVEGTFKALTLSYTDGEMIYSATLDDVLNISLPNVWTIVTAVYNITEFKTVDLTQKLIANVAELKPIVEVLTTDIMLKDNLVKILTTLIGKFSSYDLTAEEIAQLEAVDFTVEKDYLCNAIDALQETYNQTHFELSAQSLNNPQVLKGLADVIDALVPSEALEILANKAGNIVNNRVIAKGYSELADIIRDRLADDTYTNAQIMEDLEMAASILRDVADANVLNNMDNFSSWNYTAMKKIVNKAFTMNIVAGHEDEFCAEVVTKVPFIKDFYESNMVIADWHNELLTVVCVLESLTNDGIADFNNIEVNALSATTIELVCQSEILKKLVVDEINEKLVELNINAYVVTIEDLEAVTSWSNEKQAIDDLIDLMDMIKHQLNASQYDIVAGYYNNIRTNTILINKVVIANGAYVVSQMPIVNQYDHLVDTTSWTSVEWAAELDAIVAAVDGFDLGNVSTNEELIVDLTAENIETALQSKILAAGIVYEFNNKLESLGLEYTVTVGEIKDPSLNWNNEKEAINDLIDLMNMISSGTLGYDKYDIVAGYYNDIHANAPFSYNIVVSCGSYIVTKMPVVKEYYALVDTTGWSKAAWENELDAIVATISKLHGNYTATMENPIESLNAEIINAALSSEILTAGFVQEFNTNLSNLGLDYKVYQASDFDNVNDWDLELDYIRQTKDLMDQIDAHGMTPELSVAVHNLALNVNANSVLAKEILAAGLADRGYTL